MIFSSSACIASRSSKLTPSCSRRIAIFISGVPCSRTALRPGPRLGSLAQSISDWIFSHGNVSWPFIALPPLERPRGLEFGPPTPADRSLRFPGLRRRRARHAQIESFVLFDRHQTGPFPPTLRHPESDG